MAKEITRAETRQSLLLWFGILAAPLAWTLQLVIAPDLNEILCYPGAARSGRAEIYGLGIELFLVVLTAVLTVVGVVGGIAAYFCWRRLRASNDTTPASRASWMAFAGMLVSVLFVLALVVGFLPMVFLGPCEGAR